MVQRYEYYTGDGCLTADEDGDYVEHEDYSALEKQLEQARAERDEYKARWESTQKLHDDLAAWAREDEEEPGGE